jgi:hypothetical protein
MGHPGQAEAHPLERENRGLGIMAVSETVGNKAARKRSDESLKSGENSERRGQS